jgi:serine phosphatase RsbU (regulator of sigma subunit)
MPFELLNVPDVAGHEVIPALLLHQGESVGGDAVFVEVGRHDGGHLFLIVDVCGHGPQAARIVQDLGSAYLPLPVCDNKRPGILLAALNDLLEDEFLDSGRFVAALAVLIDTGGLTAANAGQPDPWIGQPGGAWQAWAVPGGTFLGVAPLGTEYDEVALQLPPESHLLAFTDGVTEAGRGRSDLFAMGHLPAFLAGLPAGLPVGLLVVRLLQALQIHSGQGWPEDDTAVLCLRRF